MLCVCFFLSGVNSRSARVLFLLVAPGHLVFLYTINSMQGGHTSLTYVFIAFYLAAALLQVEMSIFVLSQPSIEKELSRAVLISDFEAKRILCVF